MDYVAGWFLKAADYGRQTKAVAAFVATNSVCQGRQVDTLWTLIYAAAHEIAFAHTSFKWTNLASHNAGVTVVIVGISNHADRMRHLYSDVDNGGTTVKNVEKINAYLVPGNDIIVAQSSTPLCGLTPMSFGNMPNDGGHLLLNFEEAEAAIRVSGVPPQVIRPFLGSREFINGIERRCIWVQTANTDRVDGNLWLQRRFDLTRKTRQESTRPTTKKLAAVPYRFGEVRQAGNETITIVPSVSSETRDYLPVGYLPPGSIVSNLAFALYDAPLWNMALIASRLHLIWIATVCGKMKTDFRYSNTLGWNTFPLPSLTEKNKVDLAQAAENILLAREHHFPSTIADLYAPDAMPEDLRQAHERNDEVLERIYIGRRFKNDTERLEKLFDLYTRMTTKAEARPKLKRDGVA